MKKKTTKKVKQIFSFLFILISFLLYQNKDIRQILDFSKTSGELIVHFIDVGQGNATFIETPDKKTILYDAGGDLPDTGEAIVKYISSLNYNHIDVAIFSHPHADHINGAPTIFEKLSVKEVYFPKVTHTTHTFEEFILSAKKKKIKFKVAKAGVNFYLGEVKVDMVAPLSQNYTELNDYSTAVKLSYKNQSVLLTGDVENISEKEMIESNQNIQADLLLIPHHGSNSSTSEIFIKKVNPAYGVISSGKNNSYGHPHEEVLDRLKKQNVQIFNTAEIGSIVFKLNGKTIKSEF